MRKCSSLFAIATVVGVLSACSSASFDVGGGNGDETGTGNDSSTTTDSGGGSDSIGTDGPGVETILDVIGTDTTPSCTLPPPTTADLYVDAASTNPSRGTLACPFHHIVDATAYAWTGSGVRTIHVVAGTYSESSAVVVGPRVALVGAGSDKSIIQGGGSCPGGNCIVEVSGDGVIHGFFVQSSGPTGIVTDALGSALAPPLVFDVRVSGASTGTNAGILTRGSADLGPALFVSGNVRGVDIVGAGTVTVRPPTGTSDVNVFESSVQSGIYVEGSSTLVFKGGEVRHNGTNGIYLNNGTSTPHTITSAFVHGNAASGLWVSTNASAKVRSSQFQGNALGVRFAKGSSNSIDLGVDSDPGNDVLAGATNPNTHAGLCIDGSAFTGGTFPVIEARGDDWSSCPVGTASASTCDPASMPGYTDIALFGVTTSVIATDPCTAGP